MCRRVQSRYNWAGISLRWHRPRVNLRREALRATWLGHFEVGNSTARLERRRAWRLSRTGPCRFPHVHQALLSALPVSGRKVPGPPLVVLSLLSFVGWCQIPWTLWSAPKAKMPQRDLSGIETAKVNNGSQVPAPNPLGSSVIVMVRGGSEKGLRCC